MPDRPSHHLKHVVAGIFRPRPSLLSTSGSVLTPAVTSIHGAPIQVDPPSNTSPATVPSIPAIDVAISPSAPLAKDSLVDNIALALDIATKLAGFVQTVPFIAPAAGFLSQILKAYKVDLCATILRMEETNHLDLVGRLKPDIERYARLLEEASKLIENWEQDSVTSNNNLIHSERGSGQTNRLVDLAIQQITIGEKLDQVHYMAVEEKLEKWLQSPPDMRQKQHETQKLRKEGTGRWFLEGEMFMDWQDNPSSLWIQGPSGTGKSVLSSSIIQTLIESQQLFADMGKSSTVAFFYFDFKYKDGNAVEAALRRIVLQFSAQSPHPYRTLHKQYNLIKGQALPHYQDLQRILKELLRELGRSYIILDALDECPDAELGQLMELVATLRGWTHSPLHLLFTSQPRTGFTDRLEDVPCVFLQSDVTQPDIKLFITTELRENRKMRIWSSRADEIVDRVLLKTSGMFRLAACLLLELSRWVLRWLIFSAQNLNLTLVADAVAFDFADPARYTYDPVLREDNINAIPDWLEGLATIRDHNGAKTVVLTHASVQDYLLSQHFMDKFGYDLGQGPSHSFIARSCIGYLLHFASHPLNSETFPHYPLAQYAAKRWCHHLLRSHSQTGLTSNAILLLEDGSEQYSALNGLRNMSYASSFQPDSVPSRSPLHLCSEEGYIVGVRWLLQTGVDVNEQGGALHVASTHGHTEIVRLLLENGADVNAQVWEGRTALEAACTENHTDIVRLLLESGANVNAEGMYLGTALQAASWIGNREVVGLLLANGANVNAQGEYFGSALQAASSHGNTVPCENGADINREGGNYGSALAAASINGHADPVRLLLKNGADVNSQRFAGGLAQATFLRATDDAVRFLLAKGADVRAQEKYFGSALQAASMNGYTEIVRLLLENGADVNAQVGEYGSALHVASRGGHTEVIRILLDNGADVNAQGGRDGSALEIAVKKGNTGLTRLLLQNDADVNGQDGRALRTAAHRGQMDIVRLLLKHNADVNAIDRYYGTALKTALGKGHTDIIRLLLEKGADVNANDEYSGTALQDASTRNGHRPAYGNGLLGPPDDRDGQKNGREPSNDGTVDSTMMRPRFPVLFSTLRVPLDHESRHGRG
ncbi:ankyrin repeat-containing domain protein [Mycena galericulata]|nr:ankyrin repeat-containing domain protein [Mycena galericulata]